MTHMYKNNLKHYEHTLYSQYYCVNSCQSSCKVTASYVCIQNCKRDHMFAGDLILPSGIMSTKQYISVKIVYKTPGYNDQIIYHGFATLDYRSRSRISEHKCHVLLNTQVVNNKEQLTAQIHTKAE